MEKETFGSVAPPVVTDLEGLQATLRAIRFAMGETVVDTPVYAGDVTLAEQVSASEPSPQDDRVRPPTSRYERDGVSGQVLCRTPHGFRRTHL